MVHFPELHAEVCCVKPNFNILKLVYCKLSLFKIAKLPKTHGISDENAHCLADEHDDPQPPPFHPCLTTWQVFTVYTCSVHSISGQVNLTIPRPEQSSVFFQLSVHWYLLKK